MSKLDLTQASSEQGRPFLKTSGYSIRILKAEKKVSKAGNDMVVFQNEIVSPETVDGVGKIAGLQLFDYLVFGGTSEIPKQRLKALLTILKLPLIIDIESETDLKQFVGKAIKVQLRTESTVLKNEDGSPVVDDGGSPIADNNYRIVRYIGADEANTIPSEQVAY